MKTNTYKRFYRRFLSVALFAGFYLSSFSQDIETGFKNLASRIAHDPLRISGSLSAMGQYYTVFGIEHRALPFTGRINGALNIDFLGINAPMSISLSNGGVVFNKRLPSYNFIGLSPSYKWAKLHVGTRTLNFGKYSFSNHSFQGLGVELTPGKWYFSAFYGRLRRARASDLNGFQRIDPYFKRMGTGIKLGMEDGKDKILFSVFKAWDDAASVQMPEEMARFNPADNVILGVEAGKSLGERMQLEIHYAYSIYTENNLLPPITQDVRLSNLGGIINRNISTRNDNAFEARLNIHLNRADLDVAYERIDPGYITMGALFFNNDLANLTSGIKMKYFKSRWVINARLGVQQNNLDGTEANDYGRLVALLNTHIRLNDRLQFSAGASNFNNVNRRGIFADPGSPILLTELVLNNKNANASLSYLLTNGSITQSNLMANFSYAVGNTIENDFVNMDQRTTSANTYFYYAIQHLPAKMNYGVNVSAQRNTFGNIDAEIISAGINISKKLFNDRVDFGIQTAIARNSQYQNQEILTSGILKNIMLSASFKTSETSQLMLYSGFISNNVANSTIGMGDFSEFRTSLNYQYRFLTQKENR